MIHWHGEPKRYLSPTRARRKAQWLAERVRQAHRAGNDFVDPRTVGLPGGPMPLVEALAYANRLFTVANMVEADLTRPFRLTTVVPVSGTDGHSLKVRIAH